MTPTMIFGSFHGFFRVLLGVIKSQLLYSKKIDKGVGSFSSFFLITRCSYLIETDKNCWSFALCSVVVVASGNGR